MDELGCRWFGDRYIHRGYAHDVYHRLDNQEKVSRGVLVTKTVTSTLLLGHSLYNAK